MQQEMKMKTESSSGLGEVLPNVIIVDGNQGPRRKALVKALRPYAKIYLFNCKDKLIESDEIEKGIWEKIPDQNMIFDLTLIHGGDIDMMPLVRSKMRIWYSGGEGNDPRVPQDELQIQRSIMGNSGALNAQESQDLIQFAIKGGNPPRFLCSPHYSAELEFLTDVFHDILLAPKKDFDWNKFFQENDNKFIRYGQPWSNFKAMVKEMVKNDTPPIGMDNEQYNQALKKLSAVIFK